jgi:8-hydroxy-5-deazaflavin:NADPH oxidoreductase
MRVGIIGGTGPAGRGFAIRAALAGHDVVLGSRDPERAASIADDLRAHRDLSLAGGANEDAATAELVVAATPWDALVATFRPLGDSLDGTVVVSMANALVKEGREMVAILPARGSMAATLQAAIPKARVTAALHHLPASEMENVQSGLEADVLVCGDDPSARRVTCELIESIDGLRAVEVGSLAHAGAIEAFTAVCITVNIRYKVHSTLRLGGL